MALSFQSKDSLVLGRQLKTQKVSIPFKIVGNATSTSVAITVDEPSVLFVKTAGVDQITGALATNETATFSSAPVDASGLFNLLVDVKEPAIKVVSMHIKDRVSGADYISVLGSASGISTGTGSTGKMMVSCTSSVSLAAANTVDAALEIEYILDPRQS